MDLIEFSRRASWFVGALVVIANASASAAAAPDDAGFRPVSFPSLSLAKARTFSADFYVDDRDRDPWGIDVFDMGLAFKYQAGEITEFFANAILDRVVALPEAPAIPSSPRDLVFAGASRVVPNAFVGEHPYLDKRGEARFDAFIPGTITVGMTRLIRNEGLALGFSAAVAIPLAGSLNALRSGSSSGRPDGVFAVLGSHDLLGGRFHGRVGYTIAGNGSWPDRSFAVSGATVQTTETDPPIGNRLDAGIAWIRPITASFAVALEARTTKEFVSEERLDYITPIDAILGLHKSFGKFTVAASLLSHFRALPSGESRTNPLAGAIDLSNVSVADRNAFLARVGLGAAAGQLRDGTHVVAIGVSSSSLPAGAVVIPSTYTIRSEHNLGYVFTLSFRP